MGYLSYCHIHIYYPHILSTYIIHIYYPHILSTYIIHIYYPHILPYIQYYPHPSLYHFTVRLVVPSLHQYAPAGDWILLACDGIFDVMENEEAMKIGTCWTGVPQKGRKIRPIELVGFLRINNFFSGFWGKAFFKQSPNREKGHPRGTPTNILRIPKDRLVRSGTSWKIILLEPTAHRWMADRLAAGRSFLHLPSFDDFDDSYDDLIRTVPAWFGTYLSSFWSG